MNAVRRELVRDIRTKQEIKEDAKKKAYVERVLAARQLMAAVIEAEAKEAKGALEIKEVAPIETIDVLYEISEIEKQEVSKATHVTSVRFKKQLMAKMKLVASFEGVPYQKFLKTILEKAVNERIQSIKLKATYESKTA